MGTPQVCDRKHNIPKHIAPRLWAMFRLFPFVAQDACRSIWISASGARVNGGRDEMIHKRQALPLAFCGARNARFDRSAVRRSIPQIETAFTSKTAALRAACNTAQEISQ